MSVAVVAACLAGVLLAVCVVVDRRDRRRGHRARSSHSLEHSTLTHRLDDRAIESFVQAAEDPDWMAPR